MTPTTLDEATINALAAYAQAHDFLGDEEQRLVAAGRYQAAEEVHELALIAVRAWQNEIEDPEPPGLHKAGRGGVDPSNGNHVASPSEGRGSQAAHDRSLFPGDPAHELNERLRRGLGH